MQLEFPMLTISEQLQQTIATAYSLDIDNATCNTIYTTMMKMTADQAALLCQNSTYFNFSSVLNTTVALTNAYLYKDIYNPQYYQDFINTTNISSSDFDTMMYSSSSGVNTVMESAQDNIYTQYKDICNNDISSTRCAFSNLTYNQWFSGAVLSNPLPGQAVSSVSYAQNYANYTQLFVSPELGQFMTKSEQTMPEGATIGDVYQSFNSSGLYNGKIF